MSAETTSGGFRLAGLALSLALTGCAGIKTPYETPAPDRTIPFEVHPINSATIAEFIPARLREKEEELAPVSSPEHELSREDYVYRLGVGDILSIYIAPPLIRGSVANSPPTVESDEQSQYLINDRGEVFLPYHGALPVEGLTLPEAFEKIRDALARYINNPQFNLRISEFRSQKVTVVGFVNEVGTVPITDRPLTLAEAVLLARPTEIADLRGVQLKRGGKQAEFDMTRIVSSADFGDRFILQGGDVVLVPENKDIVYLLGEVPNRSVRLPQQGASLAEMLFPENTSGGASQQVNLQAGTAMPGSIFVIRAHNAAAQVHHLNGTSPESFLLAQHFAIEPNDIVFVSTRPVVRFNRFIQQLLPSLQTILAPIFLLNQADDVFDGD